MHSGNEGGHGGDVAVPVPEKAPVVNEPDRVTPTGAMSALEQWAVSAGRIAGIAESLCRTSFVPVAIRNKPAETTAVIMAGYEMGLLPIASLRSIYVVGGTPAITAIGMRGLLQSRGHTVHVVEASPVRAVVHGRRADGGPTHESVWTIERARSMRLTDKEVWVKQPQNMLIARATAECCRLVASDLLLGIPYTAEELSDGGTIGVPSRYPAPRAVDSTADGNTDGNADTGNVRMRTMRRARSSTPTAAVEEVTSESTAENTSKNTDGSTQ